MKIFFIQFLILTALLTNAYAQSSNCMRCHGAKKISGQEEAPTVDNTKLLNSVHAGLTCDQCHNPKMGKEHGKNTLKFCMDCHLEVTEDYNISPHNKNDLNQNEQLPDCITCHPGHEILKSDDPLSITSHSNLAQICTDCHTNDSLTDKSQVLPSSTMIKKYENSIHGQSLLRDHNESAATCIDCHGSHTFLPSDNPDSPVNKKHIAETCGKCHEEISETYMASIHGSALIQGVLESPTCTDCHGEHTILAVDDPESLISPLHISQTCADCHESETVVTKFDLKPDRLETFQSSFHGIAIELGDTRTANCASCHGDHNIFPQSDSRSTINPDNIESTCGECHEGLPAEFAKGTVHTSSSSSETGGGSFYVRMFYIWFIPIIIALFILYRILEYKKRNQG